MRKEQVFLEILLFGPCSLYTVVLRIQPQPGGSRAGTTLNYLCGLRGILRISYIDAPANLSEVETICAGPPDWLETAPIARFPTLSFAGRKQVGEIGKGAKPAKADRKKGKCNWRHRSNLLTETSPISRLFFLRLARIWILPIARSLYRPC